MTHPTLGYANLRFASDDAVHMPATPAATMTVACDAGNGPLSGEQPFPYDVDAAVTCPNCLHALESDWWMALMENERRTGEVSSLSGTLDDVHDAMGRLLSQADAVAEETLLGGGASMIERYFRPTIDAPAELLGILSMQGDWAKTPIPPALARATQAPQVQQALREELAFRQKLADAASPIVADISSDYLFAQDVVTFRARQSDADTVTFWARQDDARAYEHVQNSITPEKLDDFAESLAQQLAAQRSPLVPRHEPKVARPGPFSGDVPLADPGAERVRRMVEAAEKGYPPCSCPGCHDGETGCFGFTPNCTCDVDWDVVYGHEESSADNWTPQQPVPLTDSVHAAIDAGSGWNTKRVRQILDAGVRKINALPKGSTLSEQVRAAADAADEFLTEHPFDERCHRCNYDTHRCPGCGEPLPHGTEVCADCNAFQRFAYEAEFTHGGEVVDRSEYDYPDRNWCHRHNREAQAGREQCSECDGERGEDRKAGES